MEVGKVNEEFGRNHVVFFNRKNLPDLWIQEVLSRDERARTFDFYDVNVAL